MYIQPVVLLSYRRGEGGVEGEEQEEGGTIKEGRKGGGGASV